MSEEPQNSSNFSLSPFWWFAIVDVIITSLLYIYDVEFKMSLCILSGVVVAEIVARTTFHIFFNDIEDYKQALYFCAKSDLFSLIDGELWDDWKAELILSAYHTIVLLAGIGTFWVLHSWFFPN